MTDTAEAPRNYSYDGGVGEQELIKAYKAYSQDDETSAVKAIRTKVFPRGNILEIAQARGYTKQLGVRGWCVVKLGCSYTEAQNCRNAWRLRHDFDPAYEWYKSGNTNFLPNKKSGPLFVIELAALIHGHSWDSLAGVA